jgi:hypothetical protein
MPRFFPDLTIQDWVFLGVLILVPTLMAFGIRAIRREIRTAARFDARAVRLKTSLEQRRRWRQASQSRDLHDLLDDIETLLRLVNVDEARAKQEHKEAVRLFWMSFHIPIRTLLLGTLLVAGVLSAILMVVSQGPANPLR